MLACNSHQQIYIFLSDPCLEVRCGAGRICEVDSEGEPQCVCIPTCPVESDTRRKVCSNHNETWSSDCAIYQQRCLCDKGDPQCKGEQYKHVHIEYYGECRDMPVSCIIQYGCIISETTYFVGKAKYIKEVEGLLNFE